MVRSVLRKETKLEALGEILNGFDLIDRIVAESKKNPDREGLCDNCYDNSGGLEE